MYSDTQTELYRGSWRERFSALNASASPSYPQDQTLCVEIGCNFGHVIVEWATTYPEKRYIGLDWKFKAIHRAAEKSDQRGLENLLLFRAHAERLPYMFGPREIDEICLFFPDPWPRKSQWRNRLFTEERLIQFAELMKPNGTFHIRTDHAGYFDWMCAIVEKCTATWEVLERSHDLYRDHPAPQSLQFPDVTLFEKMFIKEQKPIHKLLLRVKA